MKALQVGVGGGFAAPKELCGLVFGGEAAKNQTTWEAIGASLCFVTAVDIDDR